MNSQSQDRILIIGPAWIGDMVMAQALFKLLKSTHPQIQIDILAPQWTLQLAERMPEISKAILLPFKRGELNLHGRYTLASQLREAHYHQAIVLPGSLKSALMAWWAKIPLRTGWLGEWRFGLLNDIRYLDKADLPLMVQRFMALGLPKNSPLPNDLSNFYPSLSVRDRPQSLLQRLNLHSHQPILALCPGAEYGPSKQWAIAYFAQVAKQKLAQGWQVWIFGSSKESEDARVIQDETDFQCADLTGKTTLLEAIDLLGCVEAVVCNDSGLMHIAAALNRPLVVPYGSTSPTFTPPLSDKVAMLNLKLPCSPCFKRVCPLGHTHCMTKIAPKQLLEKLNELLS
jgi:heptosyltransferase II